MHTLRQYTGLRMIGTPGAYTAGTRTGSWVQMVPGRRITFTPALGSVAAIGTFQVMEATDASGTGAQVIATSDSGVTLTQTYGTNDAGRAGNIEVLSVDTTATYDYITLRHIVGGNVGYSCTARLSEGTEHPFSNGTTQSVMFSVGG